jgi:hypothetical protein
MGSLSIVDVIRAISDDKSLALFNTIALASGNANTLKTTLKLTRRQYYSRMARLTSAGLVIRKKGNFSLSSFGRLVYDEQLRIGKAVENYWKLKAIDSFDMSSASPQLPAEEYNRVVDTLMDGNDEIKDTLHRYNNKNDITTSQKEKVYTQQMIPTRLSYEQE